MRNLFGFERCGIVFFALLLGFALAGATAPSPYPRELKSAPQAEAGKRLVVGSLTYLKDGAERKCSDSCLLIILPPLEDRAMVFKFKDNGAFQWALYPGEYQILAYRRVDRGSVVKPIRVRFAVPADGHDIYVGDLVISEGEGQSLIGMRDRFADATNAFNGRFPDRTGNLVRALMDNSEEIDQVGRIQNICASQWGIACTKQYTGVTPTMPENGHTYPTTTSLQPKFEWVGSTDPAVTYDFALFRAASYNEYGVTNEYTLGRMITYTQGLARPTWTPDQPLAANQRYLWSVRLRKDSEFSSWSTYDYSLFLIFAFVAQYNQFYKFRTPGK